MLDRVISALTSRDHSAVAGARYTENGVELPIGEGIWATADRIGPYRHDFVDSVSGEAAAFATLTEGRLRSIMALRVAPSASRTIGEIEVMIARPPLFGGVAAFGDGPSELDASGEAAAEWFAEIPADRRMSRDDLRRVADMYFVGLERNDGHGDYPFTDDCLRIENGFRVTRVPTGSHEKTPYIETLRAMSAKQQFETGFFRFVTRIRERRFPVIDETRGLVFTHAFFDHDGTVRDYTMADGTSRQGVERPFSWMIAEAFRIEDGLISRIEALMTEVPYGMRSGWPLREGDIA